MPYGTEYFKPVNPPTAIWLVRDDHQGHDGECVAATGTYDPLTDFWTVQVLWQNVPPDMKTMILNPNSGMCPDGRAPQYLHIYVDAGHVTFSPIAMLQQGAAHKPARPADATVPKKKVSGRVLGLRSKE